MKVITKAEERKVRSNIKSRARDDLKLYRQLQKIFSKVCEMESSKNINIEKARKMEEKVLRIITKIRADILAELNYFDILKPRNDTERALILAFGPFLSPEPKNFRAAVLRYLREEGFSLAYIGEAEEGKPDFKAMHQGRRLGDIEAKPTGFYEMFRRAAKEEGNMDLADSWMNGLMDTLGIPDSERKKYVTATR